MRRIDQLLHQAPTQAERSHDLLGVVLGICTLQDAIDACNGWEVDRQMEQAMDALRWAGGPPDPSQLPPWSACSSEQGSALVAAPNLSLLC